ncbi:uncharacterized protein LOC101239095 isoform X1 [Hydra vulgaris]|uniref:uncharacterized protein LOC101239095 isoform X1 n=1 Tax=Hydra vulgaris TaxID=6087 RepID=UPI001F5FA86E|nr:uncharacterized protein LOC101239095 isoform X1 [Hydra vulgaris]
MLIFFSVLNFLSLAFAQLDLSICGNNNVACFRNKEGCTVTDCNAVATYQYDKIQDKIIFVLWGSKDINWVAFGQRNSNSGSFMVTIRGQYCVRSGNVLLGNFNGNSITRNTSPQFVPQGSDIALLESKEMPDGSFFCRFERLKTLENSNFYQLMNPIYAAIAFGTSLNNNLPTYHGSSYRISVQPIDFLSSMYNSASNNINTSTSTIAKVTLNTTTITTTTIQGNNNSIQQLTSTNKPDLSKCDIEFNCFRNPSGCTSNCIAIATFFYDKSTNKYVNELWSSASKKWVAFAQKADNLNSAFMVNLQGQYCLLASSTVAFGSLDATTIRQNDAPVWITKIPGVEMIASTIFNDGSFSCKYTSNANPSKSNLFLAIAFGSTINGQLPSYHGYDSYSKTDGTVNLLAIQKVSSASSSLSNLIKGHGILMTLAWLFFATCGIFMSRYMKPFLKTKINGKDSWFRMHQLFMSSALICFVVGLILILIEFKGRWSKNAGAHHILGLTAIVLGLVQPCIALLRCTPDHKDRYIFNWVHRLIGMLAWFIAAIAVIYGLKLLNINHVAVVIFIPVVIVLFVVLDLILLKNRPSLEKSKPQVTYSSTQFDMETTSKENKTDEYISTFFMVVLYMFVAAVAIAVSISIGKF